MRENSRKNLRKTVLEKEGFSMIEIMVATFLVSVGLVAVLSLLGVGVRQATSNKNNLIAAFLAQEGGELVRNIRDTNWVNGKESFLGIDYVDNCTIDASSFNNLDCNSPDFSLYYDGSVYRNDGLESEKTIFSREIIMEDVAGGEQKLVTSVVVWGENFPSGDVDEKNCNSGSRCAFSKISLTKWKEE